MCVLSQNTAKSHAILLETFCVLSVVTHLQPHLSLPSMIIYLIASDHCSCRRRAFSLSLSLSLSTVIAASFLFFTLPIVVVITVLLSRAIVLILKCIYIYLQKSQGFDAKNKALMKMVEPQLVLVKSLVIAIALMEMMCSGLFRRVLEIFKSLIYSRWFLFCFDTSILV